MTVTAVALAVWPWETTTGADTMLTKTHKPEHRHHHHKPCQEEARSSSRWLRSWTTTWAVISGVFALLWLILRSGAKPSRLAYPCQQAAISTAFLAFGTPIVAAVVTSRKRLAGALRTPLGVACAAAGLIMTAGTWAYVSQPDVYGGTIQTGAADYRASVFHVSDCPEDRVGDRFVGLDNLITIMGRGGLKFYRSNTESLVSGPDGKVPADGFIAIKVNEQWRQRGNTNTDVLWGLARAIVNHPDGFTGEIVFFENGQGFSGSTMNSPNSNNAQDRNQSVYDVATHFRAQGFAVSAKACDPFRARSRNEYSSGDMVDGFIKNPVRDPQSYVYVSYPKFRTQDGTYFSLKYGVWDTTTSSYDRDRVCVINVPVMKHHQMTYGYTGAVKHYMGVVTNSLGTGSHQRIITGGLGSVMAEIGMPDLNILDCIWIQAHTYDGPDSYYSNATRTDTLIAGVDPVAVDIWASMNVLVPAMVANGHTTWPMADPWNPNSLFRRYLDASMSELRLAGNDVTNNPDQIDTVSWDGRGDADGDSDVDLADFESFSRCLTGPNLTPPSGCASQDFDGDGDVDWSDLAGFQKVFTGPGLF
jgi:Domain of unknown function (DUF362)